MASMHAIQFIQLLEYAHFCMYTLKISFFALITAKSRNRTDAVKGLLHLNHTMQNTNFPNPSKAHCIRDWYIVLLRYHPQFAVNIFSITWNVLSDLRRSENNWITLSAWHVLSGLLQWQMPTVIRDNSVRPTSDSSSFLSQRTRHTQLWFMQNKPNDRPRWSY